MKTCACGKHFTADEWLDLKPIGVMFGPDEFTMNELRNCPCMSTMMMPVKANFNVDEFFDGLTPSTAPTLPAPAEEVAA